ncbi:MAG TPA: hypothetical protein VNN13_01720, partial [Methylomirabilota bacterium]|nr:hypothetical protein [Methylomirabilota bacterium]
MEFLPAGQPDGRKNRAQRQQKRAYRENTEKNQVDVQTVSLHQALEESLRGLSERLRRSASVGEIRQGNGPGIGRAQ